MIPHQSERLAAYLDRELDPVARGEVEAHLSTCGQCVARLEELRAVDRWTRQLEVEAPGGYFEGFAARVRGRIESARAPAARRAPGWPAWSWAAAAAVAVAALAPLTWREWRRSDAPRAPGSPAAVAAPPAPTEGMAPGFAAPPAPAARHGLTAGADRRKTRAGSRGTSTPVAPTEGAEAELSGLQAGAAPEALDGGPARAGSASREAVPFEDEAAVPGDSLPAEAVAKAEVNTAVEERTHGAAVAPAPGAPSAAALGAEKGRTAGLAASGHGAAEPSGGSGAGIAAQAAFARLAARQPRSLVEWRAARAQWRSFAERHASSAWADEARVRAIEAAAEVFAGSAAEEDARILGRDAAEYLARSDARQGDRVRRCLEEVGGGGR